MNERLPYEEALSGKLNDLPLPDEDVSWEDMKKRLDDNSDDGVVIPPVWKGCLGYGLLLIVPAIVIWLIVHPNKSPWNTNQKESVVSRQTHHTVKRDTILNIGSNNSIKSPKSPRSSVTILPDSNTLARNNKEHPDKDVLKEKHRNKKHPQKKIFTPRNTSINDYVKSGNNPGNKTPQKKNTGYNFIRNKRIQKQQKKIEGSVKTQVTRSGQDENSSKSSDDNIAKSKAPILADTGVNIDSAKKTIDSNIVKTKIKDSSARSKKVKQDPVIKKPIYFAAGVALHQQLPVNGQQLVPYNSLGRKSTLGDYIPAVYGRIYKDKKWFLQSEFRYGAPQYTKEILYVQKKMVDTFTRTTLDTSKRLKKTYYHQLPVSFNYFVLPHFSVGFGFIWNKFSSAVSEQEIKRTNNITQVDSIITKTILHPKNADSNFVQSYLQALIETQYQWKRWSFGARYSFGVQPYIRFRLPGGERREEKNSTLGIFLRYDLWQSKKNK